MIITLQAEHYSDLADFLAENYNHQYTSADWLQIFIHWWENNPAFESTCPRGWIIVENQKIKGLLGNIPSFFYLNNKHVVAYSTTTWVVDEEFRAKSLAMLGEFQKASAKSISFNTTPSEDVINILNAFKFKKLPARAIGSSVFYPNQRVRLLSQGRKKYMVQTVSSIMKGSLRLKIRSNSNNDSKLIRVTNFDVDFDLLWKKAQEQYSTTNYRDKDTLEWHLTSPGRSKKVLFGYYQRDQLHGYILFHKLMNKNINYYKAIDLWVDWRDKKLSQEFTGSIIRKICRGYGAILEMPHFHESLLGYCQQAGAFSSILDLDLGYYKLGLEDENSNCFENAYLTSTIGDYLLY